MNVEILSINGKKKKKIALPLQFLEPYRPNIIKRVFVANQSLNFQPHGTNIYAGLRKVVGLSKRRRKYRGVYGAGRSRTPKKVLSRKGMRFNYVAAFAPHAKGGRTAHPPRVEKKIIKKINNKERLKAIRSAIAATANNDIILKKNKELGKLVLPVIIEEKIDSLKKIKDVEKMLLSIGLGKNVLNVSKKIRSGKGKMRGRKYKTGKGILFVTSSKSNLFNACRNILGSDVIDVKNLNVTLLAPGGVPGRMTVWSESAIKKMNEEKLFT